MNTPEKQRIAARAYQLLRESDAGAVVLDAGSTTEILADLIASSDFTLKNGADRIIITHALHIAAKLADAEGVGLELVGGRIRKLTWAATGSRPAQHYDQLRPDLALREPARRAIAFLASEDAHFMTGVNLPVDGGLTASNGQPPLS